jgi:HK97 family phage prohead protease
MEHKVVGFKADDIEGRTFRGYASTYDKDLGGDIIVRGAFQKTLAERGSRVKVLWQHSEPIGKPKEMREDDKGLYVEAMISKTRLGDEALELMRDGVIDQMSIGYSIPAGKSDMDESGTRIIKELKLYEFSAVTFPMNEAAIITGVKTIRDAVKMGKQLDPESKAELADMLEQLKALLQSEPPKGTHNDGQPPELSELMLAIKNFGQSAR